MLKENIPTQSDPNIYFNFVFHISLFPGRLTLEKEIYFDQVTFSDCI